MTILIYLHEPVHTKKLIERIETVVYCVLAAKISRELTRIPTIFHVSQLVSVS